MTAVTVTRYVTPLREGGSLPAIIEADDEGMYVLKFHGAGQGVRALIAELIVGRLATACSLPMPEIVFAYLDPELNSYSYAVIRVVPRVERGEFINTGIIIWCPALKLLQAETALDQGRLAVLDPAVEIDEIRKHLAVIPAICRGQKECGALATK